MNVKKEYKKICEKRKFSEWIILGDSEKKLL